ncbi:hypothetical protein CLPUN_30260 [Clostridium puniceum]|uniref:DUF4179 domain-containing protein n=2 Tax=Clostridium puniceum TaxID=29367 RepID=A0A1S8TDT8_9CLOT|nr:hypothetical protein CLPUN_30260 [Clostridium puniceum]
MQVNDDLFDDEIRKKLKSEISYVPKDINQKIDDAVSSVEKRKFNVKKVSSICAICIIGILLLGMAMPTYASNIPFIGSILEKLNYKNYKKYGSDLNITKESNGLKVTINKVVYDGLEIAVFYSIKSEEPMENKPNFIGAKLKINGKEAILGGEESGEILDDKNIYAGVIKYRVGIDQMIWKNTKEQDKNNEDIEMPNEFVLNLNIDKIGVGKWTFDIPVSIETINDKIKEKECNIELRNGYNINKIITTPINTELEGIIASDKSDNKYLQFSVFDDKGRHFLDEAGETYVHSDKDGKSHEHLSYMYKPIYDDTESLTFIPYTDTTTVSDDTNNSIAAKLNLKGETKLYSDNGKEYATITRIETSNEKTKIYYKSQYGIHVSPIYITNNKTDEEIIAFEDWQKNAEEIVYVNNSDEYVVTCDKVITEGDYSVKMTDESKSIEVYNNDKFTINIK